MFEVFDNKFKKVISDYKRCVLDYVIVGDELDYNGKNSHKEAVIFALGVIANRLSKYGFVLVMNEELMDCKIVEPSKFFELPPKSFTKKTKGAKPIIITEKLPYWYAFLDPPYSTDYSAEDFVKVNETLFPKGTSELEIYSWNDEFSNYFDDGKQWWGTAMWSIYDRNLNRFVVIGASTTD